MHRTSAMRDCVRHPRGFTVVELMVTVSLLAILLALIIPAVMHSREAARTTECRNRLKQLGLAVNSFTASHREVFPRPMNKFRDLLPYLDQAALYQELVKWREANLDRHDAGTPSDVGKVRENMNRYSENPPVLGKVPLLACPSDPAVKIDLNHSSYRQNTGTTWDAGDGDAWSDRRRLNGMIKTIYPWEPLRVAQIIDGLSNTVLYSERLVAIPIEGSTTTEQWQRRLDSEPRRYCHWLNRSYEKGEEHILDVDCQVSTNRVLGDLHPGNDAAFLATNQAYYNHIGTPNRVGCVKEYRGAVRAWEASLPASSMHPGGVNVTTVDGAVRFVSDQIDRSVWQAIGTRNAGDTNVEF